MANDFQYVFWGIKGHGIHAERDLLGAIKAKDVDEALGIFAMLLKADDAYVKLYRRVDIQYCIKDFEAGT